MSVLGDILSAFSEFNEKFKVFTVSAKVGAGFNKRKYGRSIIGILQYLKGGSTNDGGGTITFEEKPYLWTRVELENLVCIERMNGEIYRIVGNNDWKREGNFYRYDLQKFNGNTDTQTKDKVAEKNLTSHYL